MGRYGEVKSVYLGKFKRRVHHTCHHNVTVYQQTGSRAILRRESTACLLHDAYTGTPPLALHTAARDQYSKSKYSAHTPAPTPDGNAQTHNHNNNHLRAAPRAAAAASISPHSRHCPNAHARRLCHVHGTGFARASIG